MRKEKQNLTSPTGEKDTNYLHSSPTRIEIEKKQKSESSEKTIIDKKINKEDIRKLLEFTSYSREQLVETFEKLITQTAKNDIIKNKHKIEFIKSIFYKKSKKVSQNNLKEDSELTTGAHKPAPDTLNAKFKELLKIYKDKKSDIKSELEEQKHINLEAKRAILDDLQQLIKGEETLEKTYQEFLTLQERWRLIGMVPQQYSKQLWYDYHFHVQNFYDWVKLNKEAKEIDSMRNSDAKIKLCEKAEELVNEPSIQKAFNELQKLHEEWRSTGPTEKPKEDELWERFKNATAIIHKRQREFYDKLHEEQKKNYDTKVILCQNAEKIADLQVSTHKDFKRNTKIIADLQEEWKTIGKAPKKLDKEIWNRFRNAVNKFYSDRNQFYKKQREERAKNLQLKKEILQQAENLKDSSEWEETAELFKHLQKKWVKIGYIPKRYTEEIEQKFKETCDYFFNKKAEHLSSQDNEQNKNLEKKLELIEKLENYDLSDPDVSKKIVVKLIQDAQKEWFDIGFIPLDKKDELSKKFKTTINDIINKLEFTQLKKDILKYKFTIEFIKRSNSGAKRLNREKKFLISKIRKLESDLNVWENNIGFLVATKNGNALKIEMEKKIEKAKHDLTLFKEKLKVVDESIPSLNPY